MLNLKKAAICMLSVLCITAGVSAADFSVPAEIVKGESGGLKTIQKVYVLPNTENADNIPKDEFSEDETRYVFTELLTKDNSEEDVKEHTEKISIYTDTNNMQKVIAKFKPSMDISTEDGYSGTLELDYTTLYYIIIV